MIKITPTLQKKMAETILVKRCGFSKNKPQLVFFSPGFLIGSYKLVKMKAYKAIKMQPTPAIQAIHT
jgi:CDGSH-type Zn-finger protein